MKYLILLILIVGCSNSLEIKKSSSNEIASGHSAADSPVNVKVISTQIRNAMPDFQNCYKVYTKESGIVLTGVVNLNIEIDEGKILNGFVESEDAYPDSLKTCLRKTIFSMSFEDLKNHKEEIHINQPVNFFP